MNYRRHPQGKSIFLKKKIKQDKWEAYRLINTSESAQLKAAPKWHPFEEWEIAAFAHNSPICQHFGCSKILSLREQLFGNLCIHHQPHLK